VIYKSFFLLSHTPYQLPPFIHTHMSNIFEGGRPPGRFLFYPPSFIFIFMKYFFTSSKKRRSVGRREKKFLGNACVYSINQCTYDVGGAPPPPGRGGGEKKRWGSVCVCWLGEGGFKLRIVGERRGVAKAAKGAATPNRVCVCVCGCGFERSLSLSQSVGSRDIPRLSATPFYTYTPIYIRKHFQSFTQMLT
jgi:hypothetical protein